MEHKERDDLNISSNIPRKCRIPARFVFVGLGFFGFFMLYALRVNLSVAIVSMTKSDHSDPKKNFSTECYVRNNSASRNTTNGEFKWNQYTQGIILGSFFWGYIITQIPGGALAERFGSKYVLGYSIFLTSLLTLLSPIAARTHYTAFIACRALEGLFEGVAFPAMHAMIARWLPKYERGLMSTIIYSGAAIGTVATMGIAGVLSDSSFLGGWPSVFYVFGSLGVIWFVFWMFFVFETPQQHPLISSDELKLILEGQGEQRIHRNLKTPWKSILTSMPVWALVIAHFGQNWGFYTLLFQMPTYFDTVLGFNIKETGAMSSIPYLAQAICGWIISFTFDAIIKRNILKVNTVRKLSNTIGAIGPALCLVGVTLAKCDSTLNVVLLTLAMAVNSFYYSGFNVTHVDMSPDFAGSLMGLTNCVANFAGVLAPYVVGAFTSDEPSLLHWSYVFYTSSAVYVVASMIFATLGSAEPQKWGNAVD